MGKNEFQCRVHTSFKTQKHNGVKKHGYFSTEFIPNEFWITNLWFTEIRYPSNCVKALERKREMSFKAAGCQCGNRPRVSRRQLTRVFYEVKQLRIVKNTGRCATYRTWQAVQYGKNVDVLRLSIIHTNQLVCASYSFITCISQ